MKLIDFLYRKISLYVSAPEKSDGQDLVFRIVASNHRKGIGGREPYLASVLSIAFEENSPF